MEAVMRTTKFAIPEIIFGHGSIKYVAQCSRRLGANNVLMVSDSGLEASGWVDQVREILEDDDLRCNYFNDVSSNPRDYQVHRGAHIYNKEKCDVIIALGGGSPMDTAKGIATIVGNGGLIRDYEGANRIMRPLPPMIFIPTTAGSGSDISQFSIITDMDRQVKMSIISRSLVPNISIIDPTTLKTKSKELIIAAAVDALAHAIESYVSKLSSPFTESQSLKAIELIMRHLKPALDTRSMYHLEQLSIAGTAAGMSFSNAGLGIGHALAHSLGGIYDVLHGLVHPILLPGVLRYNFPACKEKMGHIGKLIMGPRICSDERLALESIDKLKDIFAEMGVPVRLREILGDDSMLEPICRAAVKDACMLTNPRGADWKDLLKICEEAW